MTAPHLLAVACGAAPAADLATLIGIAQHSGWSISVAATPHSQRFIDPDAVASMTGAPPRTQFDTSSASGGGPRTVNKADAVIVAPATYNTVNKLALGIADNYALTLVAELIGLAVPTVIVPFVNAALAARAPYQRAIDALRDEGVRVLAGPQDLWEPHPPGTGAQRQAHFPWRTAFDLATGRAAPHS